MTCLFKNLSNSSCSFGDMGYNLIFQCFTSSGSRLSVDSVVPRLMFWKALRFFFQEDFSKVAILMRDLFFKGFLSLGYYSFFSNLLRISKACQAEYFIMRCVQDFLCSYLQCSMWLTTILVISSCNGSGLTPWSALSLIVPFCQPISGLQCQSQGKPNITFSGPRLVT